MRANFEKFLFLGVMVVLTFFFNQKTYGNLASIGEAFTVSAKSDQAVFLSQDLAESVTVGVADSSGQMILSETKTDAPKEEDEVISEINDIITTPKVNRDEPLIIERGTPAPSLVPKTQTGSSSVGFFFKRSGGCGLSYN